MILFHTSTPGSEPDSGNDKIVITPDGSVGRRYRTFAGPHFWTIDGLSSGGWGPLNSGLRHLDPFRIVFSQIGFFAITVAPRAAPRCSSPRSRWRTQDLALLSGRGPE
jgi:hypothetical protein